mgnify:FL=1
MLVHPAKRVLTTRLNMTPMIDCVFLLLTFFMVVSELTRQYDAVKVELPRIRAVSELSPTALDIKVTADGGLYVEGRLVSLGELEDILAAIVREGPNPEVIVKADKDAEFKHIRAIMTLCTRRHIRIWRLAFGARPLDQQEESR